MKNQKICRTASMILDINQKILCHKAFIPFLDNTTSIKIKNPNNNVFCNSCFILLLKTGGATITVLTIKPMPHRSLNMFNLIGKDKVYPKMPCQKSLSMCLDTSIQTKNPNNVFCHSCFIMPLKTGGATITVLTIKPMPHRSLNMFNLIGKDKVHPKMPCQKSLSMCLDTSIKIKKNNNNNVFCNSCFLMLQKTGGDTITVLTIKPMPHRSLNMFNLIGKDKVHPKMPCQKSLSMCLDISIKIKMGTRKMFYHSCILFLKTDGATITVLDIMFLLQKSLNVFILIGKNKVYPKMSCQKSLSMCLDTSIKIKIGTRKMFYHSCFIMLLKTDGATITVLDIKPMPHRSLNMFNLIGKDKVYRKMPCQKSLSMCLDTSIKIKNPNNVFCHSCFIMPQRSLNMIRSFLTGTSWFPSENNWATVHRKPSWGVKASPYTTAKGC
ncbi:uncharacterized protein ACNS7B_006511 [Menidia menidia]